MPAATPSVVVRAKNKEHTIERALRGLRDQTVAMEVILVDSGSTDRTVELARPYCDQVITIPAETFTYGRALNLGTQHANGDVVFALSAHCVPPSREWVEVSLNAYSGRRCGGDMGPRTRPDGAPLTGPATFKLADLESGTTWGFSNSASSWRKQVWEQFPFDEQLIACEDKEWMWRVLSGGFSLYADPRLVVDSSHRRDAGLRSLYQQSPPRAPRHGRDAGPPTPHLPRPAEEMVVRVPRRQFPPRLATTPQPLAGRRADRRVHG